MIVLGRTRKVSEDMPPLENGDRLDQKTFHERYQAMPPYVRAELIGGIVYMSSPLKRKHGRSGARLTQWLTSYEDATPGTEAVENTTTILGPECEPQPDGSLFVLPEYGGQVWEDDAGYINGPPDFVGEISDSTQSIDLHQKKNDYEEAGVREYLVVATRTKQVFWFVRRRGKFREIKPDADGILRSHVFPGLWLDAAALLRRDYKQVLAVLRQGIGSPEHTAFVAKLAKAAK
ncbi:MAG: Uma2 family endonuclease [Planctomycetes bacterium]|nr:Uma2 family endonuclease [Planctomycetota bacterium]